MAGMPYMAVACGRYRSSGMGRLPLSAYCCCSVRSMINVGRAGVVNDIVHDGRHRIFSFFIGVFVGQVDDHL